MTNFTIPREPEHPVVKTRESRALLVAVLISLVLHAALIWSIHNKGLGPQTWQEDDTPAFRVQRATRDLVTDEPLKGGRIADATAIGVGGASGEGTDSSLATASMKLLGDASAPPSGGQSAPLVGGVEWRRASEFRPGPVGGNSNEASPRVDLPDSVMADLKASSKLDLEYNGRGAGKGASGGSAAVGAAQEMLSGITPGAGGGGGSGTGSGVGPGKETNGVGRLALTDKPGGTGGGGLGPGAGNGQRPKPTTVPASLSKPPVLPETRLENTQHLDDDFDYVVTTYDDNHSEPYVRVDITPKRTLKKLTTMPRDVVFLVDTSGSISEEWVEGIVQGIKDSIASLNEGDRFNIVLFKDKPIFFNADTIQPVNPQTVAAAEKFLDGAHSGGNTDVNQALGRLLVRDVAVARVYDLVFISDGVPTRGTTNTRELLNLITRDNDLAASIFCVGVGGRQNHELLEFLAYRNRGLCVYAPSAFKAAGVVRDLMSRLRYPIIKDVQLSVAGLDDAEVFPREVPNIHQGETLSIFGRYSAAGRFTMRLGGRNGGKPVDFTFTRDLNAALKGDKEIPQDWAFWKLHHLYSELLRRGETPELKAAVDELRKAYGLKTLY